MANERPLRVDQTKGSEPGPGVILGRKGQGPLGVEWCDGPFWVSCRYKFPAADVVQLTVLGERPKMMVEFSAIPNVVQVRVREHGWRSLQAVALRSCL